MKIPKYLHQYFWDVDVKKLDPKKKPYFVINRLLDKGDIRAVRWTINTYSKKDIKETFLKIRDFNAKVGNFWTIFLRISKEKVVCLQPSYLKMRRELWPY